MAEPTGADLIRRIFLAFKHRLDQNPDRPPLTQAQANVLFFLHKAEARGEAVSPSDLESALHLSRPTVTGLIQRLQARGFLSVTPSPQDKRFKLLHTTQAFEAHHQAMKNYLLRQQEQLLQGFSPQEKEQLLNYLTRMLHNLEEGGDAHD